MSPRPALTLFAEEEKALTRAAEIRRELRVTTALCLRPGEAFALTPEALRRGSSEPAWLFPNDVGREPHDDVAVLREIDSEPGPALSRGVGRHDVGCRLESGTKKWNQAGSAMRVVAQAIENIGEPSGTRTQDPLIKSQVL